MYYFITSSALELKLDKKTVLALTKNDNRRAICKLNDKVEFHCAIMPKKQGGYYINIGLSICKALKIKVGSKVTATFSVDPSEYQFVMPEKLK